MTEPVPSEEPGDDRWRTLAGERDALSRALEVSRQREQELADALRYRVRNALALVRSIFARTADSAPTLDHLAAHFPSRLDVLARYQMSASRPDHGFDLETMVCDELMIFAAAYDPRVSVEGPDVRLDWRQAEVLGLALHELAANSIKFGVLSEPHRDARLTIGWTLDGSTLAFEWAESGVPVMAPAPIPSGFGREYIEQALPYQLGATSSLDILPGGIRCRIAMPLDDRVAEGM